MLKAVLLMILVCFFIIDSKNLEAVLSGKPNLRVDTVNNL